MAAVKITINGVICDLYGRTLSGPVKIVGEAMYSDRQVGGGPMPPGEGAPPGGSDGDHIWGPTDPRPTPPIANVPGIDNPDLPGKPPDPVQPPIEWKAVWHPTEGWIVVGLPQFPHPAPSA